MGRGLGGNRTVTRRQSGVSNRLQGALTAPPSVTPANNPTSPTPSRQPFGMLTNTEESTETEKYGFQNRRKRVESGIIVQLQRALHGVSSRATTSLSRQPFYYISLPSRIFHS